MAEEHPSAQSLASGFLVGGGRFTLTRQLGLGGMSVIWLARDERLNESAALKFLPDSIRNDPAALADLRLETQKSRKLAHPNIIRIHDLYETPGEPAFFSMEYIEGPTLHELKQQQISGFFGWTYLRPFVKQLCDALDHAHGEGVIHRDLKPANMMIDQRERLKLADFGISSFAESTGRHAKSGTLQYMSPQQIDGHTPQVSDDIYALGATLYELLSGQPPFYEGDIEQQVRNAPAMPLPERLAAMNVRGDIPPDVAAMIMACLAKKPEKRPQSARLVAEWIGLTNSPTVSVPPADQQKIEEPALPSSSARKKSPLNFAIMAVIFAVGGFFAWKNFGHKNSAAPTPLPEPPSNALAFNPKPEPLPAPTETKNPPVAVNPAKPLVDLTFNPGSGADHDIKSILVQPNGKILVGGMFTKLNGFARRGIARFNPDGTFDGPNVPSTDGDVFAMALQSDGKIVIAGGFYAVNKTKRSTIARLNADLTLDPSFDPGRGCLTDIRTVTLNHGKILCGGSFVNFDNVKIRHLAMLNNFGRLDPAFSTEGADGRVWCTALQADGLYLVGGEFKRLARGRQSHLGRINAAGHLDPYFTPNIDSVVYSIAVQPDHRILVGGYFKYVNNTEHSALARLNPDGATDATFNPSVQNDSGTPSVQAIAVQPDGRIVIGGVFTTVNGADQSCLARLNRDGSLDQTFHPHFSGDVVRTIALQTNGKIVAGGSFSAIDDTDRQNIARLKGKTDN